MRSCGRQVLRNPSEASGLFVNHPEEEHWTNMENELPESAQKVQDHLRALGVSCEVKQFSESTRSAAEAAAAIGCSVEQIAKSIVFRGKQSDRPVLAIVSGKNRVNEKQLAGLVSEMLGKADANFVREKLGFAIGGVPPVGHKESVICFLDESLLELSELWAAGGTPYTVFRLSPAELQAITGAPAAKFCDPIE